MLIGFLVYAVIYGGLSSGPEVVLKSITQPFSSVANNVTDWVENQIDMLINADKYKEENELLKKQLSDMYGQVKDVDDLREENDQLRKIIDIKQDNKDFKLAPPCNIILRNASDVFKGFTVDRGLNDGIKIGDPVLTDIGLVGTVTDVTPAFSEVTTILSTGVHIGVTTVSGNIGGIIENNLIQAEDQKCLMSYIEKNSGIKVGDVVMTSGGSVFPAGIIVGEIVEIYDDSNGLSLHAVIKPSVDLTGITDCFVITSFYGQGVALEE
jgi:rod shape-determining protein MreC